MTKIKALGFLALFLIDLYRVTIASETTYQTTPLPVEQAFSVQIKHPQPGLLILSWKIAPNYYLYRDQLTLEAPQNLHLNANPLPDGVTHTEGLFAGKALLPGTLEWSIHYTATMPTTLSLHYQGCALGGFCYPPQTKLISLAAYPPLNNKTLDPTHLLNKGRYVPLIIGFFLLGSLLSLSPCVLPMIPILLGILAGKKAARSKDRIFGLSLLYVLSMSLTYAAAGLGFALLGQHLQSSLQSPLILSLVAAFFFLLGLSEYGYFQLKLPLILETPVERWTKHLKQGSPWAAIGMGILSSLILSPCVTPPLVGALSYIAQTGQLSIGGIALFCLGLGMGTPLLLLSLLGHRILPKTGPWMVLVNEVLALLLFGMAIWILARLLPPSVSMFLWGGLGLMATMRAAWNLGPGPLKSFLCLALGALTLFCWYLSLQRLQVSNLRDPVVQTQHELTRLLNAAKQGQQAVILDFYADWCVNCQQFEEVRRQDPAIQAALKHWQVIQVDISKATPDTQALLQRYQVIAPPTFIFLTPDGQELSQRRWVGQPSIETFVAP